MQEIILNAIFTANNLTNVNAQQAFLETLKPIAKNLWWAFRNFPVNINYQLQSIQEIYLLRYFPPYSRPIFEILSALHHNPGHLPFDSQKIVASFIACGPCPEIYGFFDFLMNVTAFRPNTIDINTFDINNRAWTYSRNIVFNDVIPSVCRIQQPPIIINQNNNQIDISQENCFVPFASNFQNSNLIVFQNCLNEISIENTHIVITNICNIVQSMSANAILLIIDLDSYENVLNLLTAITANDIVNNLTINLRHTSTEVTSLDITDIANNIPNIVKENLLTGENYLIPRKRVDYVYLVLKKNP